MTEALHVHAKDGRQAPEGALLEARLPTATTGAARKAVPRLEALTSGVMSQAVLQGSFPLVLSLSSSGHFLREGAAIFPREAPSAPRNALWQVEACLLEVAMLAGLAFPTAPVPF